MESAVFGAEFVTMMQAMEVSRGLRYKLRMMGVPIEGPTHIAYFIKINQQSDSFSMLAIIKTKQNKNTR